MKRAASVTAGCVLCLAAAAASAQTGAVPAGAGVATELMGHAIKNRRLAELGSDLVRAQILSQILVQSTKFSVSRLRPDGSNSQSFPSGHTASAFATATVVQQHLGWKAG